MPSCQPVPLRRPPRNLRCNASEAMRPETLNRRRPSSKPACLAALKSPHEIGLASQACKAPWEAHRLQKKAPTAALVQVPSNPGLPLAAQRGRPGPSRSAPEWESHNPVMHWIYACFRPAAPPAPHPAQHARPERDGRSEPDRPSIATVPGSRVGPVSLAECPGTRTNSHAWPSA